MPQNTQHGTVNGGWDHVQKEFTNSQKTWKPRNVRTIIEFEMKIQALSRGSRQVQLLLLMGVKTSSMTNIKMTDKSCPREVDKFVKDSVQLRVDGVLWRHRSQLTTQPRAAPTTTNMTIMQHKQRHDTHCTETCLRTKPTTHKMEYT